MAVDEMVLGVPRKLFDQLGSFQGLQFDTLEVSRYLNAFLDPQNNSFRPRSQAEEDPSFKQIIPYVLFHHEGQFLHYVRGKKSGEKRLVAKGSIGIGGHLNAEDESFFSWGEDSYRAGVEREVHEELIVDTPYRDHMVALLNDDSNPVGRVHLGVVHLFDLEKPAISKREAVITQLGFYSPSQLRTMSDQLESWSQLCLPHLERLVPNPAPAAD